MSVDYSRLGMDSAWNRLKRETGRADAHHYRFDRLRAATADLGLDPSAVHLAAEIASLAPALDVDQFFALIVLIVISLAALEQGSTRFPVTGALAAAPMREKLQALFPAPEDGAIREQLAGDIAAILKNGSAELVIGREPGARKPLLYLDPYLYHQKIHAAESRLAQVLNRMLSDQRPIADAKLIRKALAEVFANPPEIAGRKIDLSPEQRRAVELAINFRFTVISGGPGTGKTSIVAAIVRVLARLGIGAQDIALAAPTGKAANRIGESIARALANIPGRGIIDEALRAHPPADATLHRVLGFSSRRGTFHHGRANPLAERVVIVDEASMLDLALMDRLAAALADGAKLILLGDAHQLPSIAAGAVLSDLVPDAQDVSPPPYCAILSENYRSSGGDKAGAAIRETAQWINQGRTDLLAANDSPVRRVKAVAELEFSGVEHLEGDRKALDELVDRYMVEPFASEEFQALAATVYDLEQGAVRARDCESIGRLVAALAHARILCVTRVGPAGADQINMRIHRHAIARASSAALSAARGRAILAGEPIMMLRNDYEHSLFNGDQGVLVNVSERGGARRLAAVFERGGGYLAFEPAILGDAIALCYAMTVHKAQGSEFERIALILPERDMPILSREILYTAISRSRSSAVIFGARELVACGIARAIERFSGLSSALSGTSSDSSI